MSLNDLYRTAFFPIDGDTWADDVVSRNGTQFTFNGSLTAENSTIITHWENYYKGIARCLRILNNLDKARELGIPESKLAQYEGEANFYIGFAYGMLAFRWGDVILDKTGMTLEEAYSATRSPKSDVLSYSYECLDKAADLLPASYPGELEGFTSGAAKAFKARIAIYNGDYATAAAASKACIDEGTYSLHPNYGDLFTASFSKEWILAFKGDLNLKVYYWFASNAVRYLPRLASGYGQNNPGHELICAYNCIDGLPIDESPLYNPKAIFDNRDPRMAMTIVPFAQPESECVKNGTYKPEDFAHMGVEYSPDPSKNKVIRFSDGAMVYNNDSKACALHAAYNGFLFKKFVDPATWTPANALKAPNAYPYMRYGDVLLMYAEAMNETGKLTQDILDQTINKLRERAYAGTGINYPRAMLKSQAENRTLIRTERFVEMAAEGWRYEDLIRWRIAEVVFNRPVFYLERTWSNSATWNGDLSTTPAEFQKLVKNWNDGNYPIGGIPEIDENGIADIRFMEKAGYVVKATDRKFDPSRDYLWPIPSGDRLVNSNLTQNPGY